MDAADIHGLVEEAFNAGDVDALENLYEEDAAMATPDGEFVRGRAAIREQWSGFIALGGTIQMETRHAVVVDDTALLSNEWHFVGAGMELSSRTSEVAHRQPDGSWKYVIDHPYAGADLPNEQFLRIAWYSPDPVRQEAVGVASLRSLVVSMSGAEKMGWLRTSVGIALMLAPGAPLRLADAESPTATALILMRTIGIRDLVLGLGTVTAARSNVLDDSRRWVQATLASDSLDSLVSLVALRSIGTRDSLFAAAVALGFAFADLRLLQTASELPR